MTAKARTQAKQNGTEPETPQTFTLELQAEELNLLHQCLVQTPFGPSFVKQVAASCQAKIEALVPQEN